MTRGLRATLLATALLDELTFGFPVVALPLLRDALRLSYGQAGLIFTVGALSALVLEPGINLLSDGGSKRWFVLGGMLCVAGAFALAGMATSYALLLVAFAVLYPAIGAAVGLAQAALIDAEPGAVERTMVRWTLMSGVGDLLAPLVVSVALVAGLGWGGLCVVAAGVWLVAAVVVWPQRFSRVGEAGEVSAEEDAGEGAKESLLARLRAVVRDVTLLRWIGVLVMATMMDEVFLGFAALYLHDRLHASEAAVAGVIAVGVGGGLAALIVMDRMQGRVAGARLLLAMALVALAGVVVLLTAGTLLGTPLRNGSEGLRARRGHYAALWVAALGLLLAQAGAAGWYPVAKAGAYARRPGQSGLVLAAIGLSAPFEIALPGVVGLLAGRFGIVVGLGFLGLAPLGVLLLAPRLTQTQTNIGG
jgi:MFS family permease